MSRIFRNNCSILEKYLIRRELNASYLVDLKGVRARGIQFVQVRARKVSTGEIFEDFVSFGATNLFPLIQISRFGYHPKISLCSSTHHVNTFILLKKINFTSNRN